MNESIWKNWLLSLLLHYYVTTSYYVWHKKYQAAYVSKLVGKIGLIGSQCTAALIIGCSAIFADKAYQIAIQYGFEPKHDLKKKKKDEFIQLQKQKQEKEQQQHKQQHKQQQKEQRKHPMEEEEKEQRDEIEQDEHIISDEVLMKSSSSSSRRTTVMKRTTSESKSLSAKTVTSPLPPTTKTTTSTTLVPPNKDENIIKTSMKLFKRVPILGAMFCEVIISQCLSSLLNFQFVTEVKNSILNDEDRAGFTGNVSSNGMNKNSHAFLAYIDWFYVGGKLNSWILLFL